eukprot:TRINITY_DN17364_c0_g1_i2.p1 TRINITY_DN17364_c0_g1~~TRINITY_DN17364_c0_g1_i2.p1  ORF type:complete len:459 (+),score=107.82 TRINITY_DN17364_c0_g1_i2:190-1566(+)
MDVPLLVHPPTWGVRELRALLDLAEPRKRPFPHKYMIEYFPGDAPLILAAPHDGTYRPEGMPQRARGVRVRDTGTKGVAAALALEAVRLGLPRPHLLVLHVSRTRVDVNRDRESAATDERARRCWDAYHALLARARAAVVAAHPRRGLFVDIHCQGHWKFTGLHAIELGTLCPSGDDLLAGAGHLEGLISRRLEEADSSDEQDSRLQRETRVMQGLLDVFSMPRLAAAALLAEEAGASADESDDADGAAVALQPRRFAELLLGPRSLGALLSQRGYPAVPSPQLPVPPLAQRSAPAAAAAPCARLELGAARLRAIVAALLSDPFGCAAEGRRPLGKTCNASTDDPSSCEENNDDCESDGEDGSSSDAGDDDGGRFRHLLSPFAPPTAPLFSGRTSYTLRVSHHELDSVQVECPARLTKQPANWAPLASALLGSLRQLWAIHLGIELCAAPHAQKRSAA